MQKVVFFLLQIVLRFCAIVSLPLHLPHKFLWKRYFKQKNKIRNEIPILMNNQEIITQSKEMTKFLLLKLDSRFPNKRVSFARDSKFRNGIFSRA